MGPFYLLRAQFARPNGHAAYLSALDATVAGFRLLSSQSGIQLGIDIS